MILVGVGADHGFQTLHALLLQIGDDELAVIHIAAVDEHIFPAAFQQRAVRLTHVYEMNRQGIPAGDGAGGRSRVFLRQAAAAQQQCQKQDEG